MVDLRNRNRPSVKSGTLDAEVAAFRARFDGETPGYISGHKHEILTVGIDLVDYRTVSRAVEAWRRTDRREYVAVLNPHSVVLCGRDPAMRMATAGAALALPDGIGIILAARILGYKHQGRVAGPTLLLRMCDWGRQYGHRHFFFGGRQGVAEKLSQNLRRIYPGLQVAGTYSPPFRPTTDAEDPEILQRINSARPDVLWVGLGAPKQEKWMAAHVGRIAAPAMIGVGAAFDFHSGTIKWAPAWIRTLGIEWLYRLVQEPRRMWRRNLDSPLFILRVLAQQRRFSSRRGRPEAAH